MSKRANKSKQEEKKGPKVYTYEEVAKHDKEDDMWMVIHGRVYDVTPFLEDHPGGPEILGTVAGRDATEEFDDVFHSDNAKDMLPKYELGIVEGADLSSSSSSRSSSSSSSSGTGSNIVLLLLPIAFAVVAVLYTLSS